MPHQRKRYLEDNVQKCMNFSGLVGVLGHRQVGKTTLLEKLCSTYYTLDIKSERDEAQANPENYLKTRAGTWVGLDECQVVPDLFPELKEWVRKHKKPGQFLLSGSVRFTSREAIKESLTGRIINLELLPFTVSETQHATLPSFCYDFLRLHSVEGINNWQFRTTSDLRRQHHLMSEYFQRGGLPGVCFIRDDKLRNQKINEQINTLLDRDLRLVKKIQLSLSELRAIVTSLASLQGQPLDYTRIQNETGISTPTVKKVIYALEAIFLIRTIAIEGSTISKTIYFEDQAEHSSQVERELDLNERLIHFCYTNIRAQFEYRLGETTKMFQYRTRGGALIPIAFKTKSGCLGVVPLADPDRIPSVLGSVNSFLRAYDNSKVLILFPEELPNKEPFRVIQSRVVALPVGAVV